MKILIRIMTCCFLLCAWSENAHTSDVIPEKTDVFGYVAEGYQCVENDSSSDYTNFFTVNVYCDGKWNIHIIDDNDRWPRFRDDKTPKNLPVSIQMTYDGVDTYYVRDVKYVDPQNNKTNYVPHSSYISQGALPLATGYSDDGRGVIWFAFMGGAYMNTLKTNTFLLPWKSPRTSLFAYGFRYEARKNAEKPFTLSDAQFYRDTSLDLTEDEELSRPLLDTPRNWDQVKDLKTQLKLRNQLWKNGDRACVYTVNQMTNIAGMDIPLECVLERSSGLSANPVTRHHLVVTNVYTLNDNSIQLPATPYARMVKDSRFRYRDGNVSKDQIMYSIDKGTNRWLQTNDVNLQRQFQSSSPRSSINNLKLELLKRYSIVTVLILSAIIIPYYLYRKSSRKTKTK